MTACCFDKTGTLTSDDLVLRGVVPLPPTHKADPKDKEDSSDVAAAVAEEAILPPAEIGGPALWVLAACHSLMTVDGRVAGDSMERAAVEGLRWSVASSGDVVLPPPLPVRSSVSDGKGDHRAGDLVPIRIHHRFAFNSALRRMSVLASRPLLVRCAMCA